MRTVLTGTQLNSSTKRVINLERKGKKVFEKYLWLKRILEKIKMREGYSREHEGTVSTKTGKKEN